MKNRQLGGSPLVALALLWGLALTSPALAQGDFSRDPGYVDIEKFVPTDQNNLKAEINLKANVLKLVANLSRHEEPEFAATLDQLKLIRLNSFGITESNRDHLVQQFDAMNAAVNRDPAWERIFMARDGSESYSIFIRTEDGTSIDGLLISGYDLADSANFINIVGTIDLSMIARIGERFDIDALEEVGRGLADDHHDGNDHE